MKTLKDKIISLKAAQEDLYLEDIRQQAREDFPDGEAECHYCTAGMSYDDYYGSQETGYRGIVYKCPNEGICPSEYFNYFFHSWDGEELQEGYPC